MQAEADAREQIKQMWKRQLVFLPIFFVLLFAPAWTLDYWQAWLYGFVFIGLSSAIGIYFLKRDPKVLARRMRVGPKAEGELSQKIIMSIILAGFAALIVLPGFDHRWHWSSVPAWVSLLSLALVILGFLGTALVARQNSYAASTITVEENQPVVSTGLYAVVRHPMYAAALLLVIFTPLALGSCWSLLIVLAIIPALAWRLLDEERYLKAHLPGYAEYCKKVRWRLVPGIW